MSVRTHGSYWLQPFLLVDGSGSCVVLPAGADVTGGHESATLGGRERLILDGDTIYVAGNFKPVSVETAQQIQSIEPEPIRFAVNVSGDQPQDMSDMLQQAAQQARAATDQATAAAGSAYPAPALPVVCAPAIGPFIITAKDGATEEGWYGLLAWIDLSVLLGSCAMLAFLVLTSR